MCDTGGTDAARNLAFRLRLMVLQRDAEFMSPSGICRETERIEDVFDIRLRHALCAHPVSVHLWREATPN